MTTTVGRNATKAMVCQEEHLSFPVVGVQWPAMRKDHGGAGLWSPDLVVDLGAILDSIVRHSVEDNLLREAVSSASGSGDS